MTVALNAALITTMAVLALMVYKVHVMEEKEWMHDYFEPRDNHEDRMYHFFTISIVTTGVAALTFIISYLLVTGLLEIFFS